MRITAILVLLAAFLAGCVSNQHQVQPALQSAAQLQRIFDHEQASNLALVRSSGAPAETLAAYEEKQRQSKAAFDVTYLAHAALVGSFGGLSAEATATMLAQITASINTLVPPKGN